MKPIVVEVQDSLDASAAATSCGAAAHPAVLLPSSQAADAHVAAPESPAASRVTEGAVSHTAKIVEDRKRTIKHLYHNVGDMPASARRVFARMTEPFTNEQISDQRRRGVENLRRTTTKVYTITYTVLEQDAVISDSE